MNHSNSSPPRILYVLPNLFTMGSLFAGFYAITLLTSPLSEFTFRYASIALLFAAVCDLLDGRIARLTNTQSEFGFQMDSLIDLVSFGVAPALLVYKWALSSMGFWGFLASFAYAACAASRLARFNVLESKPKKKSGSSKFFIGLPTPPSAATLISIVLLHTSMFGSYPDKQTSLGILGLTVVLGYLMVSNLRFQTFKDVRLNARSISVGVSFLFLLIASGYIYSPLVSLVILFSSFIVVGLVGEVAAIASRFWKFLSRASQNS